MCLHREERVLEVLKIALAGRKETGLVGAEVLAGRPVGAVAIIHMREDAILDGGGNGKRKEKWVPSRDTESARLGDASQVGMKAREVRVIQVP